MKSTEFITESEVNIEQNLDKVNNLLTRFNAFEKYDARVTTEVINHPTHNDIYYIIVDLGRHGVEDDYLYDLLLSMETAPFVHVKVVNKH